MKKRKQVKKEKKIPRTQKPSKRRPVGQYSRKQMMFTVSRYSVVRLADWILPNLRDLDNLLLYEIRAKFAQIPNYSA